MYQYLRKGHITWVLYFLKLPFSCFQQFFPCSNRKVGEYFSSAVNNHKAGQILQTLTEACNSKNTSYKQLSVERSVLLGAVSTHSISKQYII